MISNMKESGRVYLDYAAATPLSEAAFLAMEPYLRSSFGNPSAVHAEGVTARSAVENARTEVATAIQVRPEYVTFTGGGTEGNNLAIFGLVESLKRQGRDYSEMEVITTKIEHPSVLVAFERLKGMGVGVKYAAVNEYGKVQLPELKALLSEKTVLFSVAYANSEIGTVQSLHAIKKVLKQSEEQFSSEIYFHVDAAQAPLWLSCQFDTVGADLLVLDFAKCNGPKGTGALVRSRRVPITATVYGGGQESGLRPGTENVAGFVGAAVAFAAAQSDWRERSDTVSVVRDQGIRLLQTEIPELFLNGAQGEDRLANNINISVPGLDTEFTAVVLDSKGFAVSTKSACAGAGGGASIVVKVTTGDSKRALSTLRFSLAPDTTVENLTQLTQILKQHRQKMSAF